MGLSYVAWAGRGVSVVRMGTFRLVHIGDVLCTRGWLAGARHGWLCMGLEGLVGAGSRWQVDGHVRG